MIKLALTRDNYRHFARHVGPGKRVVAAVLGSVVLAACSTDDTTRSGIFEPYRSDLPQGNYVTSAMLKQITVGMSERSVRRVLGTPLLTDVFQPRQWNYVFSFRHPNGRVDLRRVRLKFDEAAKVSSIDADELPETESPSDPALPGFRRDAYGRSR